MSLILFHSFALNSYFVNAFGTKERYKIYSDQMLLNTLPPLIFDILVVLTIYSEFVS